jgi:hypothetical protein
MAGFASRAAQALKDPWSLLAAGVGAGSAWAIGLPLGAVGLVGVGMLGVAAAVGGAVRGGQDAGPEEAPLKPGTHQAHLVATLSGYRGDLEELQRRSLAPAVAISAEQAVEAARNAERTANRVARAVDAVDDAVGRAEDVARRMPRSGEVRASVGRMLDRRRALLGKLNAAVEEVGELYAKLLELSTTAQLAGVDTDASSEAGQVNDALDAIRGAFDELEADASSTRALL